jgi:HAD superfamily hydrolase (TIGR01509 family)
MADAMEPVSWAVIFDVDGTMVDNGRYHESAWIELGRRHGFPITRDFYLQFIHARSNDRNIHHILGPAATQEDVLRLGNEKEEIYRESFRPVMKEIAGLTDLLKDLRKAGVGCAAASNSPKANVDMVLDGLNIRPYFRAIVYRDLIRVGKPDPEIFLNVCRQLHLLPTRCLVLEDSASGFLAAQRAGMPCIAIRQGAEPGDIEAAENLIDAHQDFTSMRLDYLRNVVDSSSQPHIDG